MCTFVVYGYAENWDSPTNMVALIVLHTNCILLFIYLMFEFILFSNIDFIESIKKVYYQYQQTVSDTENYQPNGIKTHYDVTDKY